MTYCCTALLYGRRHKIQRGIVTSAELHKRGAGGTRTRDRGIMST